MARDGAAAREREYGAQDVRAGMQRRPGPGRIEKAGDPRRALQRLLGRLAPHRGAVAGVLALVVAYSALGLAGPYLLGRAVDGLAAGAGPGALALDAGLMLAAYVLGNLLQAAANWTMADVSQRALQEVRRDLFARVQRLPMSFFDTSSPGALMSRLTNDVDAINQAVSQNVTALASSALSMVGIVAAMFALNHWLALASLIALPVMALFTGFISRRTRRSFRELQARLGELNGAAQESISGLRTVKAFRRNRAALEGFRGRNAAVFRTAVRANSYALLLMPFAGVLGNFFVILIAALGGWLAIAGLASVGTIASFINYGQNFTSPLRQVANLYNAIQAALAGAERVFEILDAPEEAAAPANAPSLAGIKGAVAFRHVDFAYAPGRPVLRDFSLEAQAGETVALVGATGAGKTTIINLLARFYEAQGGAILVDGVDVRRFALDELRRNIGIVLQDSFLFADTVMENIRFGRPGASDAECVEAARLAEADHFIRQLPAGYATALSERAAKLSQGQRQLLSISRAILADPAILVLDEATSSVDTRTELRIQRALLRLMEGRTSFVIAHRLSTIREADRIVVIDRGRIAEQGRHAELLAAGGVYARLYLSQFKGRET